MSNRLTGALAPTSFFKAGVVTPTPETASPCAAVAAPRARLPRAVRIWKALAFAAIPALFPLVGLAQEPSQYSIWADKLTPDNVNAPSGAVTSLATIFIRPQGGFTGTISFSCDVVGPAPQPTCSAPPVTLNAGGAVPARSTFSVVTNANTPTGTYTFGVTATADQGRKTGSLPSRLYLTVSHQYGVGGGCAASGATVVLPLATLVMLWGVRPGRRGRESA